MGSEPYELACGCFLRVMPDGGLDQLTCAAHFAALPTPARAIAEPCSTCGCEERDSRGILTCRCPDTPTLKNRVLTLADQIEDSAWTQEGWDYRPERVVPIIIAFIAAEFQRGRAQAEQERDAGYQRGEPYTLEQQLHDQKQRNKDLERRIRKELEPYAERLRTALKAVEQHCPCGARPESLRTHPHVIGCPVGNALYPADASQVGASQ